MLLTRKSQLTGIEHTIDLPIQPHAIIAWEAGGLHIQDTFPDLTADQREFILTGITPEEWAEAFGSDESDNEEQGIER